MPVSDQLSTPVDAITTNGSLSRTGYASRRTVDGDVYVNEQLARRSEVINIRALYVISRPHTAKIKSVRAATVLRHGKCTCRGGGLLAPSAVKNSNLSFDNTIKVYSTLSLLTLSLVACIHIM